MGFWVMERKNEALMENFNEQNIAGIQAIIDREREEGPAIKRAYTMMQTNSASEVKVTEASRKICADALLN